MQSGVEETKRKSELIQREIPISRHWSSDMWRGWSITGFYPLMLDALQEEFPYLNVDLESHSYERLYDLLYSGNLDFILTMNFPEMEKLHSDLEVMEIWPDTAGSDLSKKIRNKKRILRIFRILFFICRQMHRWNIPGQIWNRFVCRKNLFLRQKCAIMHAIVTDGSGGQCGNYGSVVV